VATATCDRDQEGKKANDLPAMALQGKALGLDQWRVLTRAGTPAYLSLAYDHTDKLPSK
jgi:hypothetical protein